MDWIRNAASVQPPPYDVILQAVAKVPRLVSTTALCPRCTIREAKVEASGFCEPCHAANIAERYQERDRIEAEARTRAWRE